VISDIRSEGRKNKLKDRMWPAGRSLAMPAIVCQRFGQINLVKLNLLLVSWF
jgi:hypothetical protein